MTGNAMSTPSTTASGGAGAKAGASTGQ
jgi:hypothetical protein